VHAGRKRRLALPSHSPFSHQSRDAHCGCASAFFIVFDDFAPRYPKFAAAMRGWLAEGTIVYREAVVDGLENAPAAFIGMLRGDNFGKRVIRVGDGEVQ
jgi:hypothetical protein